MRSGWTGNDLGRAVPSVRSARFAARRYETAPGATAGSGADRR